jgi:hypothetical protein
VSGELEPSGQSPAEMDTEFGEYPEEVRLAALEYARGLRLVLPPEPAGGIEGTPQFIILGYDGGTLVWSTDVECTQMVRRIDGFDRVPLRAGPNAPVARVPRWTIAIGAKLRSFEQHIGGDYGSALSTLLTDLRRRQQAGPPPSALPPGG